MAITIISSPSLHTPAYNEQYFVASGTNTAQANFSYVCNVLVDGVLTQRKISARPDNGYLYYNPQRIVEAAVLNTWNTSAYQIERANNDIKTVVVGIDEEYGTTPTTYAGASGTYYAWNAAYTAIDYKSYSYAATSSSKSLTALTANKVYSGQKYAFLYWHRGFSTTALYYMIVKCYNTSGSLIQTVTILNNYNGYSAPTNGIIYANCTSYGLELIKSTQPGDIISQTSAGALIPATTDYYDVYFTTSGGVDSSPSFRITVDSFCSKYPKVILNFLNKLGGYDWFVFNKVQRSSSSKKTLDYKRIPFELDSSNNYTYDLQKGDQFNYNTIITNKMTLNSDWVTEAQASWLLEMFMSPDIKYEDASGNVYSVQGMSKDYEIKKKVNDKLIMITIDLELTYEDIRQRG